MDLASAQQFFDMDDAVTGIEVRATDLYRAKDGGRPHPRARWASAFRVRDWMEINHNLFSALKLEKTVYFIVLLLIVLVAAFNIVATLIMVVMEKRKDIAILKSMGATRAGVGRIFIYKGHDRRRRRHGDRQRWRLSASAGCCSATSSSSCRRTSSTSTRCR